MRIFTKKGLLLLAIIILLCLYLYQRQLTSFFDLIIIYGDTRSDNITHQKVVRSIIEAKPDVVFHTGDLVFDGRVVEFWDVFNKTTARLQKRVDFYPVLGNHEYNAPLFFDNFDLPGNERWYFVERDNIHFTVLDSNSDISVGSEQYKWLELDLKNIGDNIKFRTVIFHHPPFSSAVYSNQGEAVRNSIVPLFEKYGVDIVFNGHGHSYERLLFNNIYYIVTGGGGAPLHPPRRKSPYSQRFIKTYHFCRLFVVGSRLIVEVWDVDLKLIDWFAIRPHRKED